MAAVWPLPLNIQSSKFNFYNPGYSSLQCTKFYSPQENQDIPSLHTESRQIESTVTLLNREGLTCRAEENPQLLRSGYCKIYINKYESRISFQMSKVYQARILDLFSVFFCTIKNESNAVTFVLIYCYNHHHV